jgi:hypothetical protein
MLDIGEALQTGGLVFAYGGRWGVRRVVRKPFSKCLFYANGAGYFTTWFSHLDLLFGAISGPRSKTWE